MKNTNEFAGSRSEKSKRFSPLSILFIFIIIAIGITVHVNNTLTVNDLVAKNDELVKRLDKIRDSNESLKNDIEKLSSLQKILPLAESMGLEYNKNEIKYFEVQK
jgi:cell division protein FtsL